MKKFLVLSLVTFLIFLSSMSYAKFFEEIKVDVYGNVAAWSVEVSTLEIEIPSESLYPGCKYDTFISTFNNSEVPVKVKAESVDVPDFLKVDIKGKEVLSPGEDEEYIITVSIHEEEEIDIAGSSINFSITFLFEQKNN